MLTCPLCSENKKIDQVQDSDRRIFYHCNTCHLIFTDILHHPSFEDEKNRYFKHNNSIDDPRYTAYLRKPINPVLTYLKPGFSGLDYGCGPVPVLSILLQKHKLICDHYDPFFFPGLKKEKLYDFIFVIESAEHFFYPGKEFDQITGLLKPEGILIIMTQLWNEELEFKTWWYARDISHVSFYHKETMDYICRRFNLKMVSCNEPDVFILKKSQKSKYV